MFLQLMFLAVCRYMPTVSIALKFVASFSSSQHCQHWYFIFIQSLTAIAQMIILDTLYSECGCNPAMDGFCADLVMFTLYFCITL